MIRPIYAIAGAKRKTIASSSSVSAAFSPKKSYSSGKCFSDTRSVENFQACCVYSSQPKSYSSEYTLLQNSTLPRKTIPIFLWLVTERKRGLPESARAFTQDKKFLFFSYFFFSSAFLLLFFLLLCQHVREMYN